MDCRSQDSAWDLFKRQRTFLLYAGEQKVARETDERTPFDIIIAKGVRTGLQPAFFAEHGTVFDTWHDWWRVRETSYGAGFRVVLSGIIIRADVPGR